MAQAIAFHFTLHKEAFFLVLKAKKPLFWSDLIANVSKDFACFLLQQLRLEKTGSLDTLVFSRIPILPKQVVKALRYAQDSLYYEGKKVAWSDSGFSAVFDVLEETKQGCVVDYLLVDGKQEFRCKKMFFTDPILIFHQNTFRVLDSNLGITAWKALQKGPAFVRHFYEEKESFRKKQQVLVPTLQLLDIYGTKLRLFFQEKHSGKQKSLDRTHPERKQAETDLHDLGWSEQSTGFSPPRKDIFSSLELLVSAGWNLLDICGNAVVFSPNLRMKIVDQLATIVGKNEEENSDLATVFQAGKTGSCFVRLPNKDTTTVLIEDSFQQRMHSFRDLERKKQGVFLRAQDAGLLEKTDDIRFASDCVRNLLSQETVLPSSLFQGKLYPYQQQGVSWMFHLHQQNWGGLLADEMGLGKTVQVLAFLSFLASQVSVVIAPAHLVYHWEKELLRFLDLDCYVHLGKNRQQVLPKKGVVITSYTTLMRDIALFEKQIFATVILDESSYVKNPKSLAFQSIRRLQKTSCFALNGTPIDNAYEELWAQFACIHPTILQEKSRFLYEARVEKTRVLQKLRPFLCKRTKQEIQLELPALTVQDVFVPLEGAHKEFYEEKKAQLRQDSSTVLEIILRLRQSAVSPALFGKAIDSVKFSLLLQDLEQLKEDKVLVFSSFTKVLRLLEKILIEKNFPTLYIDGTVNLREREKRILDFQTSKSRKVFLLSMKAASVGINLPEAHSVFILDPWWNESVEQQAMARAHRLGRTSALLVKRYIAKDTIEEKIFQLKKEKQKMYTSLVDQLLTKEDCLHLFC